MENIDTNLLSSPLDETLSSAETPLVQCKHCGQSRLDRVPCSNARGHEIKDLTRVIDQSFEQCVRSFTVDQGEKSDMGLARRTNRNTDDVARLSMEDYMTELATDPLYKELIDYRFPKEASDKVREFETKEREFQDTIRQSLATEKKEFVGRLTDLTEEKKRQAWKVQESKLRVEKERTPHLKFKALLRPELLIEIATSTFTPTSNLFLEFINRVTISILNTVYETESYQQYLTEMVGFTKQTIPITHISELYKEFCLDALKDASEYSADTFFSVQALSDFLKYQVIYRLTVKDPRQRDFFLSEVKKYKEAGENGYSDYVKHIKHFLLIKLLKKEQSELLIPRVEPYKTKYMISTLLEVTKPYHQTLGLSLNNIRLKYRFRAPFAANGGESVGRKGLRKITQAGSSQEEKYIYDFLEFYTSIQPTETIAMVTYKQGDDVRMKTYGNISDSFARTLSAARTSMDDDDEEMIGMMEKYTDYTAIYFSFDYSEAANNQPVTPSTPSSPMSSRSEMARSDSIHPTTGVQSQAIVQNATITAKALFDHYTSYCYLSGTNDEIRHMMQVLNSLPGINLVNQEFMSFSGKFEVKTRAILVKPVLEQILLIPSLARYWYPRSVSSVAGNYIYIYTPEGVNVPVETSDYVSMQVHPLRQYTITDKIWSLEFKGNRQSQIIPFISMTIALLQMVENIIYDKRFDLYRRAEQDYVMHYRKNQRSMNEQSSGAVGPMLQYGLTKREIYTASLKVVGLTKEQIDKYEDRLRPFILPLMDDDSKQGRKWKTFYASVIASINPLFERASFPDFKIGVIRTGVNSENDKKASTEFKNAFDSLAFDEEGNLVFNDGSIGLSHGSVRETFLFICYPEKGNVYYMEMKNGLPIRSVRYAALSPPARAEGNVPPPRFQVSTQRKRDVNQTVREIVGQFTSNPPDKITFFNPQGSEKYKDYITKIFPPDILRVLLSQHLWDHTREEIVERVDKLNVYLQQDMLQNLMGALIFCFVIDPETKQYVFQLPRHNQWYAISGEYEDASFLFQTKQGNYEIVLFKNGSLSTPMDHKMKTYMRQGLFRGQQVAPLKYSDVYSKLRDEEDRLEGQLFNANGKCIGFRIRAKEGRQEKIMDLRINPQAPIMASHKAGLKAPHAKRLTYLTDSRTNVEEKFGLFIDDPRFVLIEPRQIGVQMRVSKLYEQSREWKHRVYLFCRMVLNHWMLYKNATTTDDNNPTSTQGIQDYTVAFIKPCDKERALQEQELLKVVMPEMHSNIADLSAYLSRVYPNVFHDNTFHVVEEEVERIRTYMAREIELIKNYPPSFMTHFMNSRIDTKLVGLRINSSLSVQSSSISQGRGINELVGLPSITENVRVAQVKLDLSNNSYYLYMNKFDSDVDPVSITKQQVRKAELVLVEHNKKLYFLRLTKVGVFEVACYIAHMWHKEKKIMRYEETNPMTTAARRFTLRNKEIIENTDNDLRQIYASGQDYWILAYTRFEPSHNGRGGPAEKTTYAAMLPLEQ